MLNSPGLLSRPPCAYMYFLDAKETLKFFFFALTCIVAYFLVFSGKSLSIWHMFVDQLVELEVYLLTEMFDSEWCW